MEFLWEADSAASGDSGNIYEDLDTLPPNGSDDGVSDSDIFQELGVVVDTEQGKEGSKESSETQEKTDVLSNGGHKEDQNDRTICDTTARQQGEQNHSSGTTAETEKKKGKKKEKAESSIGNGMEVSENSTRSKNIIPSDSPNHRGKKKKLQQKETQDSTRKLILESQVKRRNGNNGSLAEDREGSKKEAQTKNLTHDAPLTSKNKDLQFILSRVTKNRSSTDKKEPAPQDQQLQPDSGVAAQSGENKLVSKENGKGSLDTAVREKIKEVHKIEAVSKSHVMREAAETKELPGPPGPEANTNANSLVDSIMCMAGYSLRPTAGDFMTQTNSDKSYKSSKLPKDPRKSNSSQEKEDQLDLFEDLLVGRGRDELLKEIEKLKRERDSFQESLHASLERCSGLEKDNEVLLKNISSLWKTSTAQLRQKNQELTAVRREKEEIIFRRAMRQVPRDELDRIASHIAAYDKEEFADFISKLREKEEESETKECVCGRTTPSSRMIGSVGQRVRDAARGTRLSPSSDSKAQALKNLLGKRGETVTHSEEKPKNRSQRRDLTRSPKSQRRLFTSEEVPPEPKGRRSIWDRLGRNPLDRRKTGTENEKKEMVTEKGRATSEETVSKKPLLGEAAGGKRKSVFSRLSIKRTVNDQEKNASIDSDAPAGESLAIPAESHPFDSETLQENARKINKVKQTRTLNDKSEIKTVAAETCLNEPSKDSSSKLQICSSSKPADVMVSPVLMPDRTGGHLKRDPMASSAQEPQDEPETCPDDEEEMLGKTLFGQRMKRKMEMLKKQSLVAKQPKDASQSSPIESQEKSPETTQQNKHPLPQDKVRPVTNTRVNTRKSVSVEPKHMETVINRAVDGGDINKDLSQLDTQNSEEDKSRLKKKQSSVQKNTDRQKNEGVKQTDVFKAEKVKEAAKKGRGDRKKKSTDAKESERRLTDDSTKQNDTTKLERNETTGNELVTEGSEKTKTTENEGQQVTKDRKPECEDVNSEEINTAALSLARLRTALQSQERKVKTKGKKMKKQKRLSLFGGGNSSDDEMTGEETGIENKEAEIHQRREVKESAEKVPMNPLDANKHISKEMEELLDMVENADREDQNARLEGCEEKPMGKSVAEDHAEHIGLDTNEKDPKESETSTVGCQIESLEEAVSEKVDYIDKKKRKKTSEPNREKENGRSKKEVTHSNSPAQDKAERLSAKHPKFKKEPNRKDGGELARRDSDQQTQESTKTVSGEGGESANTCQRTQPKETPSEKRVKQKSSEQEKVTEILEDSLPSLQNKCDEEKNMSRKDSKKKKEVLKTKNSKGDKEKLDCTTKPTSSKPKGTKEGALSQTPTPDLSGAIGNIDKDETNAVDGMSIKPQAEENKAGNTSTLTDMNDVQQEDKKGSEEDKTAKAKEAPIENSMPQESKKTTAQREVNAAKESVTESDQAANEEPQKPEEKAEGTEGESGIKGRDESGACAVEPTENASKAVIDEDSQETDILKTLLGQSYDEDSLFLQEEELLYDEGSEEEEEEEKHTSPLSPKGKDAGNDKNVREERKPEEKESHGRDRTDTKKHNRHDERGKGEHDKLTKKDKEIRDSDKTVDFPSGSNKEKEQDTMARSKPQGDSPPKTGDKPSLSTLPFINPLSQKGKLLGGRIKKLTGSPGDKGTRGIEEGVSPLLVREGRRGEKPEHRSSRGDGESPRSHGKRKEIPDEGRRGREARSSHVLLSQNRKSPPRLREGRQGSRKRERVSESDGHTPGKREWSPKRSPRTRGERSSPRQREALDEREQPASKRRRVSVKSRLTFRHNSDEENLTKPTRRQPSSLELERTRTSSRLRNHSGEKRLEDSVHLSSFTDGKQKPLASTVPVDSKLLQSVLAQSPSKLMAPGNEKEEGELDDEEEGEDEDNARGRKIKNSKTCDSETTKVNDVKRKQEVSKGQKDIEDANKSKVKRSSRGRRNVSPDNRDTQGAKASKTDKQKTSLSTDKEDPKQGHAETRTVSPNQTNKQASQEKQRHKSGGAVERVNSPRSSQRIKNASRPQQQTSQTKPSSSRKKLPLMETLPDLESEKSNREGKGGSEYSLNIEEQDHKQESVPRKKSPLSDVKEEGHKPNKRRAESRKKSALLETLQDQQGIQKPQDHSSANEQEDQKHRKRNAPRKENTSRKRSPLLETLQDLEVQRAQEHSSTIEEEKQKQRKSSASGSENALRKKSPLLETLQDLEVQKAQEHSSTIEEEKQKQRKSSASGSENALRKKSPLSETLQDLEVENAQEHSSMVEEVDPRLRKSSAPRDKNALRKTSPFLETLQDLEVQNAQGHSSVIEEMDPRLRKSSAPRDENVSRKKSPFLQSLQDQETEKPKRDLKDDLESASKIGGDPRRKRRSCTPMNEDATFYPGDLFMAMQMKARTQSHKNPTASSISSLSDDTIDLMVKQHNEKFPDATSASDDSETSLLKYIADDDDENNADDESEEEIQGDDYIVAAAETETHRSDERETEGEIQCTDVRNQPGMCDSDESESESESEEEIQVDDDVNTVEEHKAYRSNATENEEEIEGKNDEDQPEIFDSDESESESESEEEIQVDDDDDVNTIEENEAHGSSDREMEGEIQGKDKYKPRKEKNVAGHGEGTVQDAKMRSMQVRSAPPMPADECVSDGESSSPASPESAPDITERSTAMPVFTAHHSDSEEEDAHRENMQHSSDSEEEGSENHITRNTATPVSLIQYSDSEEEQEEEEGSRGQNTGTPFSSTELSDHEESNENRNTATPVSLTQYSDSEEEEEEEGSREHDTATPVCVTKLTDSEEGSENHNTRNTATPVSLTQYSDSEQEEEEEEDNRGNNTTTPFSGTRLSDHEAAQKQNTSIPVSLAQYSDSEEEEGSRGHDTAAHDSGREEEEGSRGHDTVAHDSDSEEEDIESQHSKNTPSPVSVMHHSEGEEEEGSGNQSTPSPVSVMQHSESEEEEDENGKRNTPSPISETRHSEGSEGPASSAANAFLPDSSSEDEDMSSSEESELDVETVDSEPDHSVKEIQSSRPYDGTVVDDQHSSQGQNDDNTGQVTEPLGEDRVATQTDNNDSSSSSSDDSDSDSDCKCSDCNNSSSSSSSSSDSSSSSSSDSEGENAELNEAEVVGGLEPAGENFEEPHGQASHQSCGELSEAADKPKSPNKAVRKSPKKTPKKTPSKTPKKTPSKTPKKTPSKTPSKTPKKTPSKTPNTKECESQNSTTPFKKTPRKSPCKKTPCKKTPLKKAQGKTPKKDKRISANPPAAAASPSPPAAASPGQEPQDTFPTPPGAEDGVDNPDTPVDSTSVSPSNTQQGPDADTPGNQLIKHPGGPAKTQHKTTVTPLSGCSLSLNNSHQRVVTPLSDSSMGRSFLLRRKVSPIDSIPSTSQTFHLKMKMSPVKMTNTAPSMPFIETGVVPVKGRSTVALSPSRTLQLSCSNDSPVISVVHNKQGDESHAPQKAAVKTPRHATQEAKVTTPSSNKPATTKKRQRPPSPVLCDTRNASGKRLRTLSPSMYDSVSPRKLFSGATNVKTVTAAHSSPSSSLGSPDDCIKASVNKDIVVTGTFRRAKRQLNLQSSSSSPVQQSSLSGASRQPDSAAPSAPGEGGSTGQVLRKSPRKPKRPAKLNL